MKGDFSRLTFDRRNHYSRVLQQRGRVFLDADYNEGSAILLHHIRTLTRDLFGAAGGPTDSGFKLRLDAASGTPTLMLSPGHYYVEGVLCENENWTDYSSQPDVFPLSLELRSADPLFNWLVQPTSRQAYLVYLEVWERHITWIEDASIRDSALSGLDTCTRSKVVWQAKSMSWELKTQGSPNGLHSFSPLPNAHPALMEARVDPDTGYTGMEDCLYRVEIHQGGSAGSPSGATFKWSRENGSVATRWLGAHCNDHSVSVIVEDTSLLRPGDWIELTHDAIDLARKPGQLVRISAIDGIRLFLDATTIPDGTVTEWSKNLSNPKVRHWNHCVAGVDALDEGVQRIVESSDESPSWIDLENGIQIAFAPGGQYRSGDYWLFPARAETANINRTPLKSETAKRPADGVALCFAPLGILEFNDAENAIVITDCRHCASPNLP